MFSPCEPHRAQCPFINSPLVSARFRCDQWTASTRVVSFLLLLAFPVAFQATAYAQQPTQRVLIVTGYDFNRPAVTNLNRTITQTIRNGSSGGVEFFYEFQESARISSSKYETEMVNYLRRKYENENINLVIALGGSGLRFLLNHENELFQGVPKIFYFHDESEETAKGLWPHVTGVWADLQISETLDIALRLHPDARNVFLITGSSDQDKFLREQARKDLLPYQNRYRFTDITDVTIEELQQKVSTLPPQSIVLYLSFFMDKRGNSYSGPEALSRFASLSNAPIYGISETYLGSGIVGGRLLDFDELGRRTGQIALQLMAGTKPQDIPPATVPNITVFDWRQLKKWKIDQSQLPPASIVRFEEQSFWHRYKWYAVTATAVLLVQATLIAWLLFIRSRRRSAELANEELAKFAAQEHRRLNEIVSNVPGLVWETRVDPKTGKRQTTFISQYVEKMLGYTVDEWQSESGFGLKLVHPDDRERVERESEALFERGKEGLLRFRWTTKDGRIVWVAAHLAPILDDTGAIIGMRGVTLDVTEQKLAEDARGESEERNRAILQAIPDLMFLQTVDGIYLDYHAQHPETLLVAPEKFLGKPMQDVLPPHLANDFLERFKLAKNGNTQIVEYELPLNGTEQWFEARIVRTGDRILTVVRDITARKRAIEELQRSEERFGKAFRANPQPMSITRLTDGLYLDVNDSFLATSGYTRDEVIGRTSIELRVWESIEVRNAFTQYLLDHGSIVNLETKFHTKTGSVRIFLSSAELLNLGGEQCLLVASSDVTERVAAQQALRESEARFRNMADTAPVMIWVSDHTRACTYVNKQWLDFTGRTIEQELGDGWTENIHPDDRERCFGIFSCCFEERNQFEMEYRLRRYDGDYRWVLDSATPRFSPDGVFLGYIGSCLDITERKLAESELRIAHEQLHEFKNQLEAENIYLQQELQLDQTFGEIIGHSDAIKYVAFTINQVAPTDSTVLISGETGTGKELVARAIHGASARNDRPLIKVNCAALSPTLIESELFGHEKGAFTGANARKQGRFELANGGTLFLDEIGELSLDLQVKLLRVLQEGELERVGGTKTIKVDVRIIAATNRNLQREVEKNKFREDLWYRLNVYPITVPPLRQRKEDIPLLVEHFVSRYAKKAGKTITSISPRVMQALQNHSWPGNIRELANVVERAVIHTRGEVLQSVEKFEQAVEEPDDSTSKTLEEVEREYIIRVLENTGWRVEGPYGAAKVLGLNPSTLRTRMLKLNIQRRKTNYA